MMLIMEAQTLIRNDPNYLRKEAECIIKAAFSRCAKDLDIQPEQREGIPVVNRGTWQPDVYFDRAKLNIPPDEDLTFTLDQYAEQVYESRRIFKETNFS